MSAIRRAVHDGEIPRRLHEIELPGIDEVLWARAVVTFAFLSPMPGRTADGQPRFWCRAGLRLAGVCQREHRLLRDYVVEALRTRGRGITPSNANVR